MAIFRQSQAQNWEVDILRNLGSTSPASTTYNKSISNSAIVVEIGVPLVMYSIGYLGKNSTLKKKAIYVAESFAVSTALTYAMKQTIRRPRPYITYPSLPYQDYEDSYSFPSGHASAAFSTATALQLSFHKWYITLPAYVWAGSVGYSRLVLGVHYPTDVLAGAVLGSGSAWLTYKLNKWLNKLPKQIKAAAVW